MKAQNQLRSGHRILYFEDVMPDRERVRTRLREEGRFEVIDAHSPEAFRDQLEQAGPDLVLRGVETLDPSHLEVLGFTLAKAPPIPTVFLITESTARLAVECFQKGAAGCAFRAPGQMDCLPQVLADILERNRIEIERVRALAELKESEKRLQDLNAELQTQVRTRTAQVEAANRELETLGYSVSHDLRAPLRAIEGFSRILLEDCHDRLDSEGQRYLNLVISSTRKTTRLIEDLLTFSRVGQQELKKTEVNMSQLADDVWQELRPPSSQQPIEFRRQPLPSACGDPRLLRLIWVNLISNAIKFTSKKPHATIEIGGHEENDESCYWIRDNGAGFDMNYARKLFGMFQRFHMEEEFEGRGAGLAIVQRLIHRHGGTIRAEAEINQGAAFYFQLPRCEEGRKSPDAS